MPPNVHMDIPRFASVERIPIAVHVVPAVFLVLASLFWFVGVQQEWQEKTGALITYPYRPLSILFAFAGLAWALVDVVVWYLYGSREGAIAHR